MSKLLYLILVSLFLFCSSQKQPQYLNNLRNLEEAQDEIALIGFDNLTLENPLIKFNTYFYLKNWNQTIDYINQTSIPETFNISSITTDINNKKNDITFVCKHDKTSSPLYCNSEGCKKSFINDPYSYYQQVIFICESYNYNLAQPKIINITTNFSDSDHNYIKSVSPFVKATKSNLYEMKGIEIFDQFTILNATLIEKKGNYFKIKLENDYKPNNNIQLILFNNGVKKIVKCTRGKYKDEYDQEKDYYYIEPTGINPEINGELQYAIVNCSTRNSKNYMMLDFGSNEGNSTLTPDRPFYKKSTGGLSTGGIIAVLIPCILVLLGIGALVYFLGMRKPPQAMTNAINNNTIGVASSENIVNK